MDGLDSHLLPGFRTHFPDYSKSQARTATHQQKVLHKILQAVIRTKTEYTNSGPSPVKPLVQVTHSPPKYMPAKLRRPLVIIQVGMKGPTSPAAWAAMALFVATGVAGLTLGRLLRMAFISSSVLTQATLELTRMQRRRPSNASSASGRRSSRTSRSARILPPPTTAI